MPEHTPAAPATPDWMGQCPKCGLRIGTVTRMIAHLRYHR